MEKTLGERRVRTDFNVSGDDEITHFKNATAKLIDECEAHRADADAEKHRIISQAQTAYEDAAGYIVKAITYKAPQ